MARYFLSELTRRRLEQRANWSALSESAQPGHFALFNKNAGTTLHVRVVAQTPDRYGWIVECASVPPYYTGVLRVEGADA